jgi:hypothetical protein
MEDKSLKDIFNDMDKLWEDFKSNTWQKMSVPTATIWETKEND